MAHDQLFKELFEAFFREFMELFFPDVAARLDFSRATFLNKETFTDLPRGRRREADLVVQVYTLEGKPEIILTHIEVEARIECADEDRQPEQGYPEVPKSARHGESRYRRGTQNAIDQRRGNVLNIGG